MTINRLLLIRTKSADSPRALLADDKTRYRCHWLGRFNCVFPCCVAVIGFLFSTLVVQAQSKKPNILVIFGDDVGLTDISAYSMGMMGFKTPNIDRIAREGMLFTDYYAENSCTAGRSTFITGQIAWRTGLSKVGVPGGPAGLQPRDITIVQAMKPLGYATGQFGKNHLGDRDEFLPTNHGFDEFFGSLYHLNAGEEPEHDYWFSNNPEFLKAYNPRGVIHSYADGKIEDTGPLNIKRMETIDDETTKACIDFITKQVEAGTPFFTWMNFTRMHRHTHVRPEYKGKAGMGKGFFYADGMWEMDQDVGRLLKLLDDLHVANDTIVIFTTDNGPNLWAWPDTGVSPFRGEKDTNWEGAFRVPAMIRWPGRIKAGEISNELFSGLDWFPTLLGAAGDTTIKDRLLEGASIGGRTFKVHLDGYNQLPYLLGQQPNGSRNEFYYFNDDAELVAMRYDVLEPEATISTAWKIVFCEQRQPGQLDVWANPFICLRAPRMFNLRMDPFEHAQISGAEYDEWRNDNGYVAFEGIRRTALFLQTFVKYPPSQSPASFSVDQIIEGIEKKIEQMGQQVEH
jgi:arylsulfatase A-like enzyme